MSQYPALSCPKRVVTFSDILERSYAWHSETKNLGENMAATPDDYIDTINCSLQNALNMMEKMHRFFPNHKPPTYFTAALGNVSASVSIEEKK